MPSIRLTLLGLLGACALSAAASSPALASSCSGGTSWVFCDSSNSELESGTYLILYGLSLLVSMRGTTVVDFHCREVHDHGLFLPGGRAHGILIGLFCRQVRPANCKLSSADETELLLKYELELTSGTTALLSGSGTGESFGDIEIEGSGCPISGTYELTGQQAVELPEGETLKAEHEFVEKKSGSKLKLGGEPATYSSSGSGMLSSDASWLTMLSV